MLSFLLWLSPVIVIAVIVWKYRRQAAAREAVSNERLKELLGKTTAQGAVDVAPSTHPPADFNPTPMPTASQTSVGFAKRERLLTQPQTLPWR